MGVSTEYTWVEVERHNTPQDLWVAIDGKVYDMTEYQQDHPGGEEILLNFAGQDATTAFTDAGHSHDAYEKLESLVVGRLEPGMVVEQRQQQQTTIVESIAADKSTQKKPNSLVFPVKMGIVAGAAGALLLLSASHAAAQDYIAEWLALTRSLSVQGISPANGLKGYLSGILTIIASQGVVATVLGLHLNKALLHRVRPLEDYPRAKKPPMPIASRDHPVRRETMILHRDQITFLTLVSRQCIAPSQKGDDDKESPRNHPGNAVYKLQLEFPDATARLGLRVGQHVKLSAEIDGRLVQRSYTPVSSEKERGIVDLIVKIYPQGRMGNYLLGLPLQSSVAVRGPFGNYHPNPAWKTIGCIAGGTGITPIYQVLREWCHNPKGGQAVLLYGSDTEEDILLREELDGLVCKYPDRIQVHHVLSHPPPGWTGLTGWLTREMIEKYLPRPASDAGTLICGPDGMVQAIRGHLEAIHRNGHKGDVFVF